MASTVTEAERALADVVTDPVLFSHALLRSPVWAKQAAIMRAVASKPGSRTAAKACHSSGKTFGAALTALWWMTRYPRGIVITTAPTWTQVEKLLWGEIHRAIGRAAVSFPKPNKADLYHKADNYLLGLSTNEGVRFQGFHGQVLIIIDEAPGVQPDIHDAINGIGAGGDVRVLMLGNPTVPGGHFYNAFTSNRALWNLFTISAFDTPNLEGISLERLLLELTPEERAIASAPHLTTRQWVYERFHEWGGQVVQGDDGRRRIIEPEHPMWAARVKGEFPAQADNALISLAHLERAKQRTAVDPGGPVRAGVDVAGPGEDETVLYVVAGDAILAKHFWPQPDPRGELVAALGPWRARLETVNVDTVGMGYYLARHLEDQGFRTRHVNVGGTDCDTEKYRNEKAAYFWGLRQRFADGAVSGLDDERTIEQLSGILYGHTPRGQIEIESKEAIRKRGGRSPDRAEALMLAYAPASQRFRIITVDEDLVEQRAAPKSGLAAVEAFYRPDDSGAICGNCRHRVTTGPEPRCGLRKFIIQLEAPACPSWE